MANYKVVDADQLGADLTTVAEAIREKTGEAGLLSFPEGMAASVTEVYDAGMSKAESDFWDAVQNYGERTFYEYGFTNWNCEYIRPKYKVTVDSTIRPMQLFSSNPSLKKVESSYFDFSNHLVNTGTGYTHYYTFFGCPKLEEIEDIGLKSGNYSNTFRNCLKLHTLYPLRVAETDTWTNAFGYCYELKNLTIDGVIGTNGFNVKDSSKLTRESLLSIVNALSTTKTGLTVTLSLTAVNNAFETSPGAADGSTSEEWLTLADTKSNWTIALA